MNIISKEYINRKGEKETEVLININESHYHWGRSNSPMEVIKLTESARRWIENNQN